MPRVVELTVPSDRSDAVVRDLGELDEVISVRLHRGVSVQPPGDVVSFDVLDDGYAEVMHVVDGAGLGDDPGVNMTTSRPEAVASADATPRVMRDRSTSSWEEVQLTIGRESAMTKPKMLVMAISGLFAGIGIHTGSLHLLIGAMLVAPAYEPLSHIAFGMVNRNRHVRSGIIDFLKAYAALAIGAAAFVALAALMGNDPLAASADTYLSSDVLEQYWTTVTWTDVVVATAGGVTGALLIIVNRRVLATGVVIALGLVPSLSLAVIEVANGELGLARRAMGRWLLDVVLVTAGCAVVFEIKRRLDRRTLGPDGTGPRDGAPRGAH